MGLQLAAVSRAIDNADLRWLLGMERQLTERENVYHEKLDPKAYCGRCCSLPANRSTIGV